ncbi:MAG: peptidoglycan DD-metalloendopeptidase family protein [Bacilli bacterium]|nr:peptidoglycan DD-metalloendopeptidase family protein [Bacilli bacterium]
MRKIKNYCFRILLALLISFSYLFTPLTVQAKQATNILELKEHLAELKSQKQAQANAKSETQSEINTKKNNIYNAYKEKENIANEVEDAKNKIVESEESIKTASEDIDNILRYYQVSNDNNNYIDYVTDVSSITDLIMRMKAVEQITSYYDNKIKTLNSLIKEKQNLQVELADKNADLDVKITNFSNALSSLNNQLEAIDEISEDIDTQIKAQEETIKYYQSICDSETQLLSTCTNDPQSFGWRKPTVKGRVSSGFGYRSFDNNFHPGIDIAGNSEGTYEYATAAGRVAAITYRSSCGGNIVYLHVTVNGQRYTVQYAHMLEIKVKLNQMVTTDTVVGTVGGYSTSKYYSGGYDSCAYGAHLHYGVATGWYHVDYNSWSKFVSNLINPPGFPARGVWWYKR